MRRTYLLLCSDLSESGRDGQEKKLRSGQNSTQNHANAQAKTQVGFSNFVGEK